MIEENAVYIIIWFGTIGALVGILMFQARQFKLNKHFHESLASIHGILDVLMAESSSIAPIIKRMGKGGKKK